MRYPPPVVAPELSARLAGDSYRVANPQLLRAIDLDFTRAFAIALHLHGPGMAAHRAILDVAAARVGVDEELDALEAVRAPHTGYVTSQLGHAASMAPPR
jgi:hypothetical protein